MKIKKAIGIISLAFFTSVLASCAHTKCAAYSSNYEQDHLQKQHDDNSGKIENQNTVIKT